MSASTGPDEHPHTAQHNEASEHQGLTSQEETVFDYDPNYVPEREFVLMPLFRRIGEMLGMRRREEPQYEEPQYIEAEPLQAAPPAYPVEPEIHRQAPPPEPAPEAAEAIAIFGLYDDPLGHDLLDIESDLPQPTIVDRESQLEPESQTVQMGGGVEEARQISEPPSYEHQRADLDRSPYRYESQGEEGVIEDTEPVTPKAEDVPKLEHVQLRPTAEEIQELVAPLREAAAEISAAVAQAAEWLRAKEEILRRAEVPQQSAAPVTTENQPSTVVPFEAHTLIATTPAEPEAPSTAVTEVPGIQREAAWQQRHAEKLPAQPNRQQAPVYQNQKYPAFAPRLELVPPPIWRPISWAQEFTPKRVALLGGLAMAVLLVLGVSLARRPASTALPGQEQTRSLQPGGVTVTTHPAPVRQPPTQQARRAAAPEHRSPAPQRRRVQPAAEYDNSDSEVVTHDYKNSKKPSPVKQTTVAGVRHYSDM